MNDSSEKWERFHGVEATEFVRNVIPFWMIGQVDGASASNLVSSADSLFKKPPSQCLLYLAFFTINKDELFFFSQGYKYNVAVYSFQQGILQHMVHFQKNSCASQKTGVPK